MPIVKSVLDNGGGITLKISGKFDVRLHRDFFDAYADSAKPGFIYRVDLSRVSYIDSSALGLLISLKEYAQKHSATVSIINPSELARKTIEAAFFHEIFDIVLQT